MVFWRTLVTGLVAWCGYHIVSMFGCGSVAFTSPLELVCSPTDSGVVPGPVAGALAATAAVAVLALTWIPPYRRRRADSAPALALATNLHRLNGYESALNDPLDPPPTGEPPTQPIPAPEDTSDAACVDPTEPSEPDDTIPVSEHPPPVDDDTQLVEHLTEETQVLAEKLTSGEARPQDIFWDWLALLKELNTKHGEGAFPTEPFTRLNTLLLDLMPQPAQAAKSNTQTQRQTPTAPSSQTSEAAEIQRPQPHLHAVPRPPPVTPDRLPVPTSWA